MVPTQPMNQGVKIGLNAELKIKIKQTFFETLTEGIKLVIVEC